MGSFRGSTARMLAQVKKLAGNDLTGRLGAWWDGRDYVAPPPGEEGAEAPKPDKPAKAEKPAKADAETNLNLVTSRGTIYSFLLKEKSGTGQPDLKIYVNAGQTVVVEIRLGRDVIPLEPLVVTARTHTRDRLAGYRERQAMNAFGKFVTREQIDRRPNTETSNLLANISSVRVVPVKRNANPNGMTTNMIMMRGGGNRPMRMDPR